MSGIMKKVSVGLLGFSPLLAISLVCWTANAAPVIDQGDYVKTAAGLVHKSCMTPPMPNGAVFDIDKQTVTLNGKLLATVPPCQYPLQSNARSQTTADAESLPAFSNPNWLEFSYVTPPNQGSNYGQYFNGISATWQVPPTVQVPSGSAFYLFDSLETTSSIGWILQPVLSLNEYSGGGGSFWTMTDEFVGANGVIAQGPPIEVSPGDTIVGEVTSTGASEYKISWTDETQNTGYYIYASFWGTSPFAYANPGVLEVYPFAYCNNLPSGGGVQFIDIGIDQPCPSWNNMCDVTAAACGGYNNYCNSFFGTWSTYTTPDGLPPGDPSCSYNASSGYVTYYFGGYAYYSYYTQLDWSNQ